jgi:phosphocarrier protein HPr
MTQDATVVERCVIVASRAGLHARPAARLAEAAAALDTPVTITRDGVLEVDAASMLELMTLGASCGDEVTLSAEGIGADAALDELAALVASELDHE